MSAAITNPDTTDSRHTRHRARTMRNGAVKAAQVDSASLAPSRYPYDPRTEHPLAPRLLAVKTMSRVGVGAVGFLWVQ
jgi:hypothetical protein